MDPATIGMLLQSIPSILTLFQNKPDKPEFPDYQGATQQDKDAYMSSLTRKYGTQTEASVNRMLTGQASRGMLRSGATGTGEGAIREGGNTAIADAMTQFELNDIANRNRWQMMKAQYENADYQSENKDYLNMFGAAGANLGNILGSEGFAKWLEELMKKNGGRDIVPTQPGQFD